MSSIGSRGPDSWHAQLIQAASKGDEPKVRELVCEGFPREDVRKDAVRIALQRVAGRGHEQLTRLLLEEGAAVDVQLEGEVPPLFRAAELGRDKIVKLLLQHGASTETRDKTKRTAIFPAAQRNHKATLSLLLEAGADVNVKDADGQNLLLCLASEKSEKLMKWDDEIIRMLLRTNLDLEAKDKEGRTALLWAAATGKVELIKLVLTGRTHNNANIKATNNRGKTALHLAVESKTNRLALVKTLLEHEANVHAESDGGWTALLNAADKGYEDIASVLLHWGADVNARTLNNKMTGLHWCARNGHMNVVKLFLQQPGVLRDSKDSSGETPLLGAAQNGHTEIVSLLSPVKIGEQLSSAAQGACRGFQATVVDFGMEHRPVNTKKYPVFDLLYGWDEKAQKPIVTTVVRNVPAKPRFRWIHLPANNVAWVETLITKHFIENSVSDIEGFKALEKIFGQQHRGPRVHAHFMRPLCQRMQPTGKDDSSVGNTDNTGEDPSIHVEAPTPTIVLPEQENTPIENHKTAPKPAKKRFRSDDNVVKTIDKIDKPRGTTQSSNISKKPGEGPQVNATSHKRRGDRQSSRSGMPMKKKGERNGNIVLFMPYLHYETHEQRKKMTKAIERATGTPESPCTPDTGITCDEMLMRAYLSNSQSAHSTHNLLHIRRTLDQFYYHAISTETRDEDQVVFRYTRDHKPHETKVFMVDQLWLWTLGSDLIITSFPQRWEQPKDDPLNVLDGIIADMDSKTRPPVKSVHHLATLITGRCSGVFDRHRLGGEHYQFLDMFESSIGEVTNRETELFRKFNDASVDAARWLTHQRQRGQAQFLDTPSSDNDPIRDPTFVDTLLDIGEETNLLAETKDIRDELNMISMVLKHQVSVIEDLKHALLEEARGPQNQQRQSEINKRFREQHKVIDVHLKDVERMDKQADSIYTSLTHLLDLKQKHANAFEARFARDQAAFTGRQGQTIMVFTIVTIVFLPMSFIAAVFAIPVRDFPHQDGAPSIPFSYVSKIMFGVGLAISIPLIAVAFAVDNLGLLIKRTLRSLIFWRRIPQDQIVQRRSSRRLSDVNVDDEKILQMPRRSADTYRRRRSSFDIDAETRPIRRSIYSKERSWKDDSGRNGIRISRDLERGFAGR